MSDVASLLMALRQQGVAVTTLCNDSRRLRPGEVFIAYPGAQADGRLYIDAAVQKGAAAVLYEPEGFVAPSLDVPALPVPGLARRIGEIAHEVYGRPSENLWLAGITGTNGKTSVSQFLAQALSILGQPCAVIGTLGSGFFDALTESPNTTPEAITIHHALADFRRQGARACAMEVSSIGLDQGRVAGLHFATAILTNLTRDHLEYHGTMARYAEAKAQLFTMPGLRAAVLNLDDPFGVSLARRLAGHLPVIAYTLDSGVTGGDECLVASAIDVSAGLAFLVNGVPVRAPLVGRFNVANLLAVIGALRSAGYSLAAAAEAVGQLKAPPGRMETQGGDGAPLVVVDYAHTPDALEQALTTLREAARARGGRLICVFGCGGDRDPGKRPMMGEVAQRLADRVIVTTDNPRSESPADIAAAVAAGMCSPVEIELERSAAIHRAVVESDPRDVVLLAGKGHENYQEIAATRHPFSDRDEARAALESRT